MNPTSPNNGDVLPIVERLRKRICPDSLHATFEEAADTIESLLSQHERDVRELRGKLRMIVSHASGGALSEPEDIDRSINDICVEISRHKNDVYAHGQEVGHRTALSEQRR